MIAYMRTETTYEERMSMRFLFASDSFKGTITSEQSIRLLTEAANKVFPGCETVGVPVADGGEGTVEAVIKATKGRWRRLMVQDRKSVV